MTRNAEMYNPMRAYLTVHIPPPPRPLPPGAQDPTFCAGEEMGRRCPSSDVCRKKEPTPATIVRLARAADCRFVAPVA